MQFNFDDISAYSPLTKKNILLKVSQLEIFRHYVGYDFEIQKNYSSPLREDTNPSFNIYINSQGEPRYKDFGYSQGTCFDFVKELHGLSNFFEVIIRINCDLNLELGCNSSNKYSSTNRIIYTPKHKEIKNTLIQIGKPAPWEDYDLSYWALGGITKKLLKEYDTYKANAVYLNKKLFWINRFDNPIYAYLFRKTKHLKCYRPFEKKYSRFITNCTNYDIQGYDQLVHKGELLYITKSMKDVLTLIALGFNAIAPQGEGHHIPVSIVKELQKRFNKIIVFYDNDIAGVKASLKLTKELDAHYFNTPKSTPKDPFAFVKEFSADILVNLMNKRKIC